MVIRCQYPIEYKFYNPSYVFLYGAVLFCYLLLLLFPLKALFNKVFTF